MALSNKRFAMPRRSEEDLRGLARDLVTGQAWMPQSSHEFDMAFMTLTMGLAAASWVTDKYLKQVGTAIGYYKDTFPRGVNGIPMFYAATFIHYKDQRVLWKWITHYQEALA